MNSYIRSFNLYRLWKTCENMWQNNNIILYIKEYGFYSQSISLISNFLSNSIFL